jgi:hypothetical protein
MNLDEIVANIARAKAQLNELEAAETRARAVVEEAKDRLGEAVADNDRAETELSLATGSLVETLLSENDDRIAQGLARLRRAAEMVNEAEMLLAKAHIDAGQAEHIRLQASCSRGDAEDDLDLAAKSMVDAVSAE